MIEYYKNNYQYLLKLYLAQNISVIQILKNLKSFCGKKDAFDCAGIRAQVFRLPIDLYVFLYL